MSESELSQIFEKAMYRACPACDHDNVMSAQKCSECGASLPRTEEEVPLSFLHEAGLDTSLLTVDSNENSPHLRTLRLCLEGVRSGQMSFEDYEDKVNEVYDAVANSLEMLESDMVQGMVSKTPQMAQMVSDSIEALTVYARGCERMLDYEGGDLTPAVEGLALAEQGLREMELRERDAVSVLNQPDG